MAFVRSKKIKGNKYYYLVESKRIGSRVVQKVVRYLGASPTFPKSKAPISKKKKKK